jgi:hypothetical protein
VGGDTLGGRAGLREESRRLLMADLSLGTAEVGVDRGSQNGVCECQLSAC